MSQRRVVRFVLVVFVSLLAACTSDGPEDVVTLDGRMRFDNLVDARAEFIAAEARWRENEPPHYRWRVITDRPEPALEVEVENGEVIAELVADHAWENLPRTPEEGFALMDRLIAAIEDDPGLEGNWSDCSGSFFGFRVDPTYGVPVEWGDSDPCSDVIPVAFELEVLD